WTIRKFAVSATAQPAPLRGVCLTSTGGAERALISASSLLPHASRLGRPRPPPPAPAPPLPHPAPRAPRPPPGPGPPDTLPAGRRGVGVGAAGLLVQPVGLLVLLRGERALGALDQVLDAGGGGPVGLGERVVLDLAARGARRGNLGGLRVGRGRGRGGRGDRGHRGGRGLGPFRA